MFDDPGYHSNILVDQTEIMVPALEVRLAMKFNSVGNRTKDDKKIKDICDITALYLFTSEDRTNLLETSLKISDVEKRKNILENISEEDISQSAKNIDVPENVIASLIDKIKTNDE